MGIDPRDKPLFRSVAGIPATEDRLVLQTIKTGNQQMLKVTDFLTRSIDLDMYSYKLLAPSIAVISEDEETFIKVDYDKYKKYQIIFNELLARYNPLGEIINDGACYDSLKTYQYIYFKDFYVKFTIAYVIDQIFHISPTTLNLIKNEVN
jgi:hypothetical protein